MKTLFRQFLCLKLHIFKNVNFDMILSNLVFLNLRWGHATCPKNVGPNRFSFFDVYWIQTNTQTSKEYTRLLSSLFSLDNFIFELLLWNSAILYDFPVFGGFFFLNWPIFKKMFNYLPDFFFLKIFHKPSVGSCEVSKKI